MTKHVSPGARPTRQPLLLKAWIDLVDCRHVGTAGPEFCKKTIGAA